MQDGSPPGTRRAIPLRTRIVVIAAAALISLSAGAFAWRAFVAADAPGGRGTRQTLPPLDERTIPVNRDGVPTVLVLRCDATGIEILTPEVVAQADGLHIRAYVSEPQLGSVAVRSTRPGSPTYLSGDSGVDAEFVRSVSPGRAQVACGDVAVPGEGGPPGQWVPFRILAPDRGFVEYELDCADGEDISLEHQVHAPGPADAVTAAVNGLLPDDTVEEAGFGRGQGGQSGYVRVVRAGSIVARFDVAPFGDSIYYIHAARACAGSGISMADPAWVALWTSDEVDAPPEGVASYIVSGVTLKVQPDVPSDAVVIEYHLDWSTGDATKPRECVWTVFDAGGGVIAQRTVSEHVPAGTDSGGFIVVDGEPATASVTCEP